MLFGFLIVLYVFVCIFLCLLVLVQSDKGGGINGTLGGGMSNASALLGAQDTANILTRATTIFASGFMVLCIVISLVVAHGVNNHATRSALQQRAEKLGKFAPSSILQQPLNLDDKGTGDEAQLPLTPLEDNGAQSSEEQVPAK